MNICIYGIIGYHYTLHYWILKVYKLDTKYLVTMYLNSSSTVSV